MKKLIPIIFMVLLCLFTTAFAVQVEIPDITPTITIQELDYQTGSPIYGHDYNVNESFMVLVRINIPKYADISNCRLAVGVTNIKLYKDSVLRMETGDYVLKGMVTGKPAQLSVSIIDESLQNAQTPEEIYRALITDRGQTVKAVLGKVPGKVVKTNEQRIEDGELLPPKTGDKPLTMLAILTPVLMVGLIILPMVLF